MQALRNRAVVAFLVFNVLAGAFFVGGALWVSFMRSFGTTPVQLGWILAAGSGASVLGALVGGHLTDSLGPRKTVLLTAVAVTVGLAGKAVARAWLQAGASNLWIMAAQAAMIPASKAMLRVAAAFRGRAMGLFDATMYLGGALGDGGGGWLWQTLGARPSFALAATASAVAASLLFRARWVGSSLRSGPAKTGPSREEPSDA